MDQKRWEITIKDAALVHSSLHLLRRQKEAGSTQEEAKKVVSHNLAHTTAAEHGAH